MCNEGNKCEVGEVGEVLSFCTASFNANSICNFFLFLKGAVEL